MTNIYNIIKEFLSINKNKVFEHALVQEQKLVQKEYIIKQPSNAVLELARKFKNNYENNQNSCENDTVCTSVQINEDDLYIRFEKFIIENSIGGKRPSNKEINKQFKLQRRKRDELIEQAIDKGLLIRKNPTTTIFNINYEVI